MIEWTMWRVGSGMLVSRCMMYTPALRNLASGTYWATLIAFDNLCRVPRLWSTPDVCRCRNTARGCVVDDLLAGGSGLGVACTSSWSSSGVVNHTALLPAICQLKSQRDAEVLCFREAAETSRQRSCEVAMPRGDRKACTATRRD
jgi:hypothetical protein